MSAFRFSQPVSGPMYDQDAVRPMREELKQVGVQELLTPEAVNEVAAKPGTMLVVVNSVCGCAAGNARPGVMIALQNAKIPDYLTTVFAGQEREATARARELMTNIPPSSPCIALFKDGKPVFVLPRHHIENRNAEQVAEALTTAFNEHCDRQGPSIPREEFEKISPWRGCGSSIPFAQN